jgi:pimeloyl-ACP methyl ester carboxylesterase
LNAINYVRSNDGTTIAFTSTGDGPGVVVVPGNGRMAHNYEQLARQLGDAFSVHVVERRGRGASGPQGDHYSIAREVEDLNAVVAATGACGVFGHSYGGLVAMQCARCERQLEKLIVYEPGVSIDGSLDLSWLPRYEAAFHAGKLTRATAIFLRDSKLSVVSDWPQPVIYVLAFLLLQGRSGREMRNLMATNPSELREVQRADSDGSEYAAITADTLLLGGENGTKQLLAVLPKLQSIIPQATLEILPGLNHNGPDLGPFTAIVEAVRRHLQD